MSADTYKITIHFPDHDEVYRTECAHECEARTKADNLQAQTGGVSWSVYRALTDGYMGQGTIGPDGSRTPTWVTTIIGWRSVATTRKYRNMD